MYKEYFNGMIEVIVGPMFSGKSAELIRRVDQLRYAHKKALVFKPEFDQRWKGEMVKSRTGLKTETLVAKNANDILDKWDESYKVIAIDEAQFFDDGFVDVVTKLANKGVRVIVAALDQDFKMKPFGFIGNLLAIAEKVDKLSAICVICGKAASTSYRKVRDENILRLGSDEYEARCRECHIKNK